MSLLELKDKVQRYLMDMGLHGIEVIEDGYTFRHDSTRVFITVEERGEGEDTFSPIIITAPVVSDLKPTPELFEYVARHADDKLFGHLGLKEDKERGVLQLVFTHTLLGDFLDPQELERAVAAVAITANEEDDKLAAQFGGTVFHKE